jgi:flagellar basal body P-ring protein FlgI
MGFASRAARSALLAVASIAALTAPFAAPNAWAGPRIKDVADIEGVREN